MGQIAYVDGSCTVFKDIGDLLAFFFLSVQVEILVLTCIMVNQGYIAVHVICSHPTLVSCILKQTNLFRIRICG